MNRGQVEIEHPAQPEVPIIVRLLLLVVVPDFKIVGDVEEIVFVLLRKKALHFGAQVLEDVGKVVDSMSSIVDRRSVTTEE
jgi:hypothetical protein